MITIKLKVKKLNQVVIISSSQRLRMINKVGLPFRMRVPKNYLVHKQAERDIKTNYGQGVGDMLAHECYGVVMANETNGQKPFWIGWEMYWAGYARGIRQQRQADRQKKLSVFDLIGADDIHALSEELGINPDNMTNAVMEIIAKRKIGGVA